MTEQTRLPRPEFEPRLWHGVVDDKEVGSIQAIAPHLVGV